ncbi:DUF3021 domain-containing protein [Weissella coleopterorum]|uniref:DUF3021 domain-containing protein n=1 Tax=Weissella coleopterorum TaxID=2714949 RepID=A0A6G8B0C5_9LACO|nr:DUF3021 family protein [Weissella coleopterorum]QIL50706.1 DUF3021 domain-containing protein [Weissella coleopterorum]
MVNNYKALVLRHVLVGMIFGAFSQMLYSILTGYIFPNRQSLIWLLLFSGLVGLTTLIFDLFERWPKALIYLIHFGVVSLLALVFNFNGSWFDPLAVGQVLIITFIIYLLNIFLSIYLFKKKIFNINKLLNDQLK